MKNSLSGDFHLLNRRLSLLEMLNTSKSRETCMVIIHAMSYKINYPLTPFPLRVGKTGTTFLALLLHSLRIRFSKDLKREGKINISNWYKPYQEGKQLWRARSDMQITLYLLNNTIKYNNAAYKTKCCFKELLRTLLLTNFFPSYVFHDIKHRRKKILSE